MAGMRPVGRKVPMKKFLKLAVVMILALAITAACAEPVRADGEQILMPSDTMDWHYYLRRNSNGTSMACRSMVLEGTLETMYCMNPDKQWKRTLYNGIAELGNDPMTTAMVYCMMNGPKRYDGTSFSSAAYTAGDFRKDYYITQLAIWCLHTYYAGYGPKSIGTPADLTPEKGYEDVWQHISDLYTDAIAYAAEHPDGYAYLLDLGAAPTGGDSAFHLNADRTAFEKSIDVTWSGEGISSSDIICQPENAPAGTECILTEKDDRACRAKILVRVPASVGLQAGQSITCHIRAEFGQWRVRQLIPPEEKVQTLMYYTNVIPEALKASVELTVPTGHIRVAKVPERPEAVLLVSSASLAGAIYEVRDQLTGETVGTLTTNEQGVTETLSLREGVYTLKEISAPEGYSLDENEYSDILITDRNTEEHPFTVTSVEPLLPPPTVTPTPILTPTPTVTPTVTPTTTPTVMPSPTVTPTVTHPVTPTEIVREPEPKKTKAQTVTTKPADTGDRENTLSLVLLMVGAGGLIGLLVYARRRKGAS